MSDLEKRARLYHDDPKTFGMSTPAMLADFAQQEIDRIYGPWVPIIAILKEWNVDPVKEKDEVRRMVSRWFAWP